MTYQEYLQSKKRSESSIKRSGQHLLRFRKWLKSNGLKAESLDYPKLLDYLREERSRGIKEVSLRHYLRYVRWYYDYLLVIKKIKVHPLEHLNLNRHYQNTKTIQLHTLLTKEELEVIYTTYCSNQRLSQQNKILLGILIYQGIAISELPYLKINHLDLENGKLEVPENKNHQGRKLKLAARQILGLANFINNRNPNEQLLKYKNASQASNSRQHLSEQIKIELAKSGNTKIGFINLQQIRRSVISIWVKENNLREAQYLAGHKWVHSTEVYLQDDIEELQEQIELYHPLQ